jgi:membrane protease YdiL (CAAX protease family)
LIILATALYGLLFALLRWRTGSILGAILVHGLMDFASTLLLPNTDVVSVSQSRPNIPHPFWMIFGLVLIIVPPIYLWLFHPLVKRYFPR